MWWDTNDLNLCMSSSPISGACHVRNLFTIILRVHPLPASHCGKKQNNHFGLHLRRFVCNFINSSFILHIFIFAYITGAILHSILRSRGCDLFLFWMRWGRVRLKAINARKLTCYTHHLPEATSYLQSHPGGSLLCDSCWYSAMISVAVALDW